MENKLRKPQLNLDWMDGEPKSDKWRKMIFLESGRTLLGSAIYPTADMARLHSDSCVAEAKMTGKGIETGGFSYYPKDYRFCLPIPVKE